MLKIKANQLKVGDEYTVDDGHTWNTVIRFDGVAKENLSVNEYTVMLLTTRRAHVTIISYDSWTEDTVEERRWLRRDDLVIVR